MRAQTGRLSGDAKARRLGYLEDRFGFVSGRGCRKTLCAMGAGRNGLSQFGERFS